MKGSSGIQQTISGWTRPLFLTLLTLLLGSAILTGQPSAQETRAIWVTRGEYRTAEDIREIIANCVSANLNVVLFQVRGNGTAYYDSPFEPWAEELGGRNPGFDPLALAIEEAHKSGLQLHAWINAMPGWRGLKPPQSHDQLFYTHPEWFVVDSLGNREPMTDHYIALSAGIPDVQEYLRSICVDLASRYDIDGLHLDYIRYSGAQYSYDKPSVDKFFDLHGTSPLDAPEDWKQFRRDQVTEIVRLVSQGIKAVKPGIRLSVAALRIYSRAYDIYGQDARAWLREGLVDDVYNMMYVPEMDTFSGLLADGLRGVNGKTLFPGIMVRNQSIEGVSAQIHRMREIGARGFAIFSYGALFPRQWPASAPDSAVAPSIPPHRILLDGPLSEKALPVR